MTQITHDELAGALDRIKNLFVVYSGQRAEERDWDEARISIEAAKQIDQISASLNSGNGNARNYTKTPIFRKSRTEYSELPYYYVEHGKLIKVGRSRNGGTYIHRVTEINFVLMMDHLCDMSRESTEFPTHKLIDRCSIPNHEPLIMVDLLRKHGLLVKVSRGYWRFTNPDSFPRDAKELWSKLPRQ